ncbi:MAG TPA: M1 family metallopeptidase [Burkholderiales bacterium]|nr:M1 family metallopeptidase [Burkholderiales bacterium]
MRITCLWAALVAATLAHAQDAKPQPPAFRLGDTATPLEYALELAIDPRATEFSGEARIAMRINRYTNVLWLNATKLTIESVRFEQENRTLPVAVVPGGEDFVGIVARGPHFQPGIALVTIRYRASYETVGSQGLFRQVDRGDSYVLSQFEPLYARQAFPCFDEPGWKTPWRMTIDAPADDVVVSNTPQLNVAPAPDRRGWTRHEFAQTRPLPAYLVALAVGPFEVVDGGTAGAKKTRLRYLALKGRGGETKWAAEVTPRLLELLEEYFGIPYPFEKLDALAIPQTVFFGAMENVGLITYASSLLLATPREETREFRRRYASVAAHEMAHMWFGNLVTLSWWDDAWLNEAFATWMANKVIARYRPEWSSGWWVHYARARALELDRLASARRIRNPVAEKNDIHDAFDDITYLKGAAVLSTFENWFGPEPFRDGVRAYLKRHALGNATAEDFIGALGAASGKGAEALAVFRGFIEQPGVPLIDVALDCAKEPTLALRQQRLRPVGSSAQELRWTTPACVRYGSTTQCADVQNGATRVKLDAPACPAWLAANAGGRSYYVPRYEAALAKSLRSQAAELSPDEIVGATVDARVLAQSGLLPLGEALAWGDAAVGHPYYVARLEGIDLLHDLRDAWLSEPEAAAKRDIIARRVRPLAAELGWNEAPGDSDDLRELRARLLPYAAETEEDAKLRSEARTLASAWLAKREAVPGTLTRAVLDTAARFADAGLYGQLEGAALATQDLRERHYLLAALAKTRDDKLRSRAFGLALRDEVNGRDAEDLLSNALEDDANRRAAFDFLRANYDALAAKLPRTSLAWLLSPLGDLCTPEERELFAGFFKERARSLYGGPRQYQQSLERIDLCIAARNHS